jgi:1-acyl-sn-glycerol-3-phosphate acyltransferase
MPEQGTPGVMMLRSLIFLVVFYLNTAIILLLGSPLLFGPRSWAMAGLRFHAITSMWWLKVICGTRLEVRGRERLPDGPALIASKHQSAWDTFGLVPLLRDPAIVMKEELLRLPVYGWFSRKFEMIPIRREAGPSALRLMARESASRIAQGRDVLIFPEGTRRLPGAPPAYQPGIALLYGELGVPCVPVALNSGVFWPRRSILRRPGTIIVEFQEPIPAGLPRREFVTVLEQRVETATARLVGEASGDGAPAASAVSTAS